MRIHGWFVLLCAALCAGAVALAAPPPLPPTPAPVSGVLYARPFTVDAPFHYEWAAGQVEVREGTILVIEAAPELLRTRETQEPLLFVGRYPAHRASRHAESGRVVVFVPTQVDLARESIWFGTPGTAEQVTETRAASELAHARATGIAPVGPAAARAARARGGDPVRFANKLELLTFLDTLREQFTP